MPFFSLFLPVNQELHGIEKYGQHAVKIAVLINFGAIVDISSTEIFKQLAFACPFYL